MSRDSPSTSKKCGPALCRATLSKLSWRRSAADVLGEFGVDVLESRGGLRQKLRHPVESVDGLGGALGELLVRGVECTRCRIGDEAAAADELADQGLQLLRLRGDASLPEVRQFAASVISLYVRFMFAMRSNSLIDRGPTPLMSES